MPIQNMTAVCAEQIVNYNTTCPTAFDDIAVINQLDMDLVCLKMRVKV